VHLRSVFSEPTPMHVAPQGDRHPVRLPRE
jgi:hypothetical protein